MLATVPLGALALTTSVALFGFAAFVLACVQCGRLWHDAEVKCFPGHGVQWRQLGVRVAGTLGAVWFFGTAVILAVGYILVEGL